MWYKIKNMNSIFPEINLISEAMDNKVTTIVGVVGIVALLNYFSKLNEEDSIKIILAIVYTLSPN